MKSSELIGKKNTGKYYGWWPSENPYLPGTHTKFLDSIQITHYSHPHPSGWQKSSLLRSVCLDLIALPTPP